MLDRKTKDVDASVELLEDRTKVNKIIFSVLFFMGWVILIISIAFLPYNYDEMGIGAGIAILILATYFYIDINYYTILIMIKKLDTKDEKLDIKDEKHVES